MLTDDLLKALATRLIEEAQRQPLNPENITALTRALEVARMLPFIRGKKEGAK